MVSLTSLESLPSGGPDSSHGPDSHQRPRPVGRVEASLDATKPKRPRPALTGGASSSSG